MFPVTLPLKVFIQKNPYPKVFSALPTPNQRKTCIKHTFLTKKIMQKKNYRPTYPIFFRTVTGNKLFIFLGLATELIISRDLHFQEMPFGYSFHKVCIETSLLDVVWVYFKHLMGYLKKSRGEC